MNYPYDEPDEFWASQPPTTKDNNDDLPAEVLALDERTLR